MLSVIAMRRPEDEELGGRGDGDEFVDISHMQLLVEAGPSGLHYGGPPPPHAQPQPYAQPPAHSANSGTSNASVDDLFALYFNPSSHDIMDRKKRKCYSNAQVAEALSSIRQGMSIYKASRQYNIPETTLRSKRDGLYENEHCGKQPVLNLNEERQIVDWIHYLGKCGFPVTKNQLLHTVFKLVENLQRPNPFKEGVPGKKWFSGFMLRHPAVSKRVAQNLPTSRNQVTEVALRAWFDRVQSYFKENDLLQVLQDPKRIFNCDETGFFLCPKDKQVLVKKGSKRVYNRVANDEKECLTVLVNVSADGNLAPPMVLFPYKRLPNNIKSTVPSWWGLGNTESGWMTMESFYEYVANVFYPWLQQQEITLPVVLFLDGHSSHISLPLTTFCKEKGIVLVALLPNSTHVLQPLDVAVFRPVKGTWRDIVREFRVKHNYAKLKRTDFCREVEKCFHRSLKPETIMSGFKCCGLYPFDEQNIDYDKLLSKVKKHQDKLSEANQNTLFNTQQMSNIDNNEQFKKQFESRLSQNTLKLFKEAGNQWTGDPTYEKLFLFWKSLTSSESIFEDQADSALDIGETTFTNNVDIEIVYDSVNFDIRSDGILTPLNYEEANDIGKVTPKSSQVSLSSINVVPTIEENTFEANSLLPKPLVDSPVLIEIIDPRLSEVTPPQKIRLLTEEKAQQILRSSTPELSKCSSAAPSVSEIENADDEVNSNCSSSLSLRPNRMQKKTLIDKYSEEIDTLQNSLIMPSTSKAPTPIVIENVTPPTPFKGIPTPFKNAFFFPKTENTPQTKKLTKKVTPTVAIAAEFMEHQRRLDKEKEEKEKLKQLRKCKALEKKRQKENDKKIKQAQTEQKKEEPKKISVMKKLKDVNMRHVKTLDKNSIQNSSDSDDDFVFNISAKAKKIKHRNFFDSDDSV